MAQRTNLLCLAYFFLSLVWIIDYNYNNNEGKALIYYDQIILTCRVYQYGIMVHSSTELKRSVVYDVLGLGLAVSTAEILHCTSFMTTELFMTSCVVVIVSVSIATSNHNSKDYSIVVGNKTVNIYQRVSCMRVKRKVPLDIMPLTIT